MPILLKERNGNKFLKIMSIVLNKKSTLIGLRTEFGGTCLFRSGSESQHEVASLHKSTNMAMHVPKAPGFAQMLKDGAKVF